MKRKLQNLLFTLIMMMVWSTAYAEESEGLGTNIVVISDIHVMATSLFTNGGADGAAWTADYAGQRKMLAVSADYFNSFAGFIGAKLPKILLVTGDLTKDGELASHSSVRNELSRLLSKGIKVFVIPGNHDINTGIAYKYDGDNRVALTTAEMMTTADAFKKYYADYGYGKKSKHDPNGSLSYVAEPVDGLVLLAIDSHTGSVAPATLSWICQKAKAARIAGKQVIAMMHHPLFPHITGADLFIDTYAVANHEMVRDALIDAGVKVILTGHFHTSDIAQDWKGDTKSGESIYDVSTGSLVSYPCDYRTLTLSADKQTLNVTTSKFDSSSKDFLLDRVASITKAAIESKINAMTNPTQKAAAMAVATDEVKNNIGAFAANLFITHAEGDEYFSANKETLLAAYNGFKANPTLSMLLTQAGIDDNAIRSILEDKSNYGTEKADMTHDRVLTISLATTTPIVPGDLNGDLNGDNAVDVTDVVELIDMVLAGIYDSAGDINNDGEVDVTDVVELIDIVLSGE